MQTKILIVDDEADIIEVVRLSLMSGGYDFIDASTGQEALKQARSEKPNLIIMDVSMPEMDGLETLRRLKQHTATAHIPVIMLTARDRYADVAKGQQHGCDFYCTKPFTPHELTQLVKRALATA